MATSRTGTAIWKQRRDQALTLARANGQTHCRCGRWLDWDTSLQPNSPEPDHRIPFADSGDIAPPLEELEIICRRCNGSEGGSLGAARQGKHTGLKTSRDWKGGGGALPDP